MSVANRRGALSPFILRLVVGSIGTAAVGVILVSVLIARRRKRIRTQETALQPPPPEERSRQPSFLQNLVIAVVASVISGVALYFITPLLSPALLDTTQRPDIAGITGDASISAEPQQSVDPDLIVGEDALEPVDESETVATSEPAPPEPAATEQGSESTSPIEVAAPAIDVLVADTTTTWEGLLQPPRGFEEVPRLEERLQIVGASVAAIMQLTGQDPLVPFETLEPRILLDGAGLSSILLPIAPPTAAMDMTSRALIQGAQVVRILEPVGPSLPYPGLRSARVLIEGAKASMSLELNVPELDQHDT